MPPRFYVPEASDSRRVVALPEEEAAHLTRVLRLAPGDEIRIFNGRGDEWQAIVRDASRRSVSAELGPRAVAAREARIPLTLAMAVLKGDKMDDVVRDAVMLGVHTIQPIVTARSEITMMALLRARRVERWQRIAVSSAKQCGRAVVPAIQPALRIEDLSSGADVIMLAEPTIGASRVSLSALPTLDRATLLVGPEGGWAEREVQNAAARGAMLLTLGSHTLRADAAPLVALTALRVRWEDF